MKSKIIIGIFAVFIIGLLVIAGCRELGPLGPGEITCDDGRVVPFGEGCEKGSQDEIETVLSFHEWKEECFASRVEVNAVVVEKTVYSRGVVVNKVSGSAVVGTPPARILEEGLLIEDDGVTKEYSFSYGQIDEDVWELVEKGKRYLFVIQDGKIVSAVEGEGGKRLSEYKKICSLGPTRFKGKVVDVYFCTPPSEGTPYKCGKEFILIKDGGSEMEFTEVQKEVLKNVGIGQEYVFVFENQGITKIMPVGAGFDVVVNPPEDKKVFVPGTIIPFPRYQGENNEYSLRKDEIINVYGRKIKFIGTKPDAGYFTDDEEPQALLQVDDNLNYKLVQNAQVALEDCVIVTNKNIIVSGENIGGIVRYNSFVVLKIEKSDACNDVFGVFDENGLMKDEFVVMWDA